MGTPDLKYDNNIPVNVSDILSQDFCVFRHIKAPMLVGLVNPIKFSAFASIFLTAGSCKVDINLITYKIEAPSIINIRINDILQIKEVSQDIDTSFMVFSQPLANAIFMNIKNVGSTTDSSVFRVISLGDGLDSHYLDFYDNMYEYTLGDNAEFVFNYALHSILAFYYRYGYKAVSDKEAWLIETSHRIADGFISLVQNHFKTERFLDFYAGKLGISAKHLSRTLKNSTGFTAVEWIERYVTLEAKVLLTSTNMTIQQISDTLHFPSQSAFGKYFKKCVGMSPKSFRNIYS